MIDIHCHILPMVDDGSPSMARSLEMLKEAEDIGVTDIILTPHFRLDMFLTPYTVDQKVFEEFKREAQNKGIKVNLYLGQEVHHDKPMLNIVREQKVLTLNGTRYVLLEFDFRRKTDIQEQVYNYRKYGYRVIVAHFERYVYATLEEAEEIKSLGGEIQVNAYTILGKEGKRSKKLVRQMLKLGLVDYVASDVHHNKDNDLAKAFKFVKKRYGKVMAEALFNENAKKLLGKKD